MKRARRQSSNVPQVAIAGYTNAGKSTLMRAPDRCRRDRRRPAVRDARSDHPPITLPGGRSGHGDATPSASSRKLPHDLVEAFRSTLEEVTLAELVLHVADASSPDLEEQIEAVRRVLGEIGAANMPEVLALNKMDRLRGSERARLATRYPGSAAVSALTGEGVHGLLESSARRRRIRPSRSRS